MKNALIWLVVLLMVLVPFCALAQSQGEFALSCSHKVSAAAEVFSASYTEDADGSRMAMYTSLTTLPEETCVRPTGAKDDAKGLRECWYYKDGKTQKGWIEADLIISATVVVYVDNGTILHLNEQLVRDDAAMAAFFAERYPGHDYGLTPPPTPTPVPTPTPEPIVPDAWVSVEDSVMAGNDVGVKLVKLGVTAATVMDEAFEIFTISPDQLTFAEGVDAAHRIAVIHAPRSGSAALREKAAANGKKLEACVTGAVVPVLAYGEEFTLVRYEGREGYVMTDALLFFTGSEKPQGEGVLHMKGKVDGKSKINIRTTTSASSAKVGEWPSGLSVTVLEELGEWYAIEYDGWFGYVHEQYLIMQEGE